MAIIPFPRGLDLFGDLQDLVLASWQWVVASGTLRCREAIVIAMYWREDGQFRVRQTGGGSDQKSES